MSFTIAFGPLVYELRDLAPVASLEPWQVSPVRHPTRSLGPDALADPSRAHHPRPLHALLADCAVLDAPARGHLVLHAAGVHVAGGVALLVAPSGTGKSTAARHAGERAFAFNAVLVDGTTAPRAHPLPFGADEPAIPSPAARPLVLVARLARGSTASFEWLQGPAATICTVRACVYPRGPDPHAIVRARLALDIASRVRAAGVEVSLDSGYLQHIDRALKGLARLP